MSSTVFISGSCGYVGSHFVKFFSSMGWKVYGVDLTPPSDAVQKYLSAFLCSDIADEKKVSDFCKIHKPASIVHCAAKCLVEESMRIPQIYIETNVTKAEIFLKTALLLGVELFLFSSTGAVYGNTNIIPIPETHPKNPINEYGKTKLAFENILLNQKKLTVGIFRYFNVAGADLQTEIGELHNPETHIIPNALNAAWRKKEFFEIYGTDYKTRDGTCERDYIHVWDLAAAHHIFVEKMKRSKRGGIYNLGTGTGFTVKEILDEVEKQTKQKIIRIECPRRPGDPPTLVANPSLAYQELGWKPNYSDLPTIISTAMHWQKKLQK